VRSGCCFIPVVHGWRHANHAAPGEKNAEFGTFPGARAGEPAAAHEKLAGLFGAALLPLFVPPWNRIDPAWLPVLVSAGYTGLSTFGPRQAVQPLPGLFQINTHVDPIDWRGSRDLVAPDLLVHRVIALLDQRLSADADCTEPLGILTHHLVHTPRVWDFTARLLAELLDGGAVPQPLAPLLETRT
jgi:hypothetical protein